MSETTVIENESHDVAAPAQLPADTTPAPSNADTELDDLLREFDEKTRQPEPATDNALDAVSNDELDKFLADVSAPSVDQQRAAQLQSELDGLRGEIHRQQEEAAFSKFADSLQERLPPHIPPGFAKDALMSMAHDPAKQMAWLYRNVDRVAVGAELRRVEAVFAQLPANADPNKVAQLKDYGTRLGIAYNAAQIIRAAERDIIKRAESFKPIDVEVTEDRAAIVASVIHDGLGPRHIPEPPVQWGRLSGKEFREKVIRDHGFDPGTW